VWLYFTGALNLETLSPGNWLVRSNLTGHYYAVSAVTVAGTKVALTVGTDLGSMGGQAAVRYNGTDLRDSALRQVAVFDWFVIDSDAP
jgi:hypothetical protein